MVSKRQIRIISAPSILGLKPNGVELLADRILSAGLPARFQVSNPPVIVADLNHLYNPNRDPDTGCLNTAAIKQHSMLVAGAVEEAVNQNHFALVLGGDCSILIGVMVALRKIGQPGLVFLDAHADFYSPERSVTGEIADMDLAIVSGNGPALLTDINMLRPYVNYEDIIHLGQRDQEETTRFDSPDIRLTGIRCFSEDVVRSQGVEKIVDQMMQTLERSSSEQLWIHFDTDVLDDKLNPAVDYRLPGGLSVEEVCRVISAVLGTGKCVGMTVTIYNPRLDIDRTACENIISCMSALTSL
jgi:arginase